MTRWKTISSAQADASVAGEDKAGTETVDGIPPATSDDTYPAENGNNGTTEDPSNEEPSNKDSSNEEPSNENPSQVTADQITIGENDSLTPVFSFVQDYTADDATAAQKTVTFTNKSSDTAVNLSVTASGDANQAATAVWAGADRRADEHSYSESGCISNAYYYTGNRT